MKFLIVSVGKTKTKEIGSLIDEYKKRITKGFKIEEDYFQSHKNKFIDYLNGKKEGDYIIVCTEFGKEFSTEEFKIFIERKLTVVKRLIFFIGDHDGFERFININDKRIDLKLSLSRMTFSHEIARLLLVEQLYRVLDMIKGGNYHK